MDKNSQLDPLPGSNDKDFWGDGEVNSNLVPQKVHDDSPHNFVRKSGREAQCTHCDWGFALDPGEKVRDGHVYTRDGELVI